MFYTYLHRRADDGKVFYIGKGRGNRAGQTFNRSTWWKNVVGKHGLIVEKLAEWRTEADAFKHERFLIACFRDMGHPLVNLTDGGEGTSGFCPSEETRAKLSLAKRGKPHSPEHREKLAEHLRARNRTDAQRARVGAAHRGKVVSEESRARMRLAHAGKTLSAEHRARIRESVRATAPRYTAVGLSLTAREWAQRLGLQQGSVCRRVRQGLLPTGERA